MSAPLLTEASIKDICDELSKRNLNFVLVSNYYDGRHEDEQPVISFGVRKQDLTKAIGMIETTKSYLIDEFSEDNDIQHPNEEENDDELPF